MPEWAKWMAAHRRKTLVVCRAFHMDIQHECASRDRRRGSKVKGPVQPNAFT